MSAVPKTTALPNALDNLVPLWIEAKRAEDFAKIQRLEIEERILAVQPANPDGAVTVEAGGYKVTLTASFSYKADDMDTLSEITRKWDRDLVPIKTKTEVDATGCKWLRANRPDLWSEIARVMTVKPLKTSVSVKV